MNDDQKAYLDKTRQSITGALKQAEAAGRLGLPVMADFWREISSMIRIGIAKQEEALQPAPAPGRPR